MEPAEGAWRVSRGAGQPPLRIALVGKYVELHDAYMSVREALIHASTALGRGQQLDWINSEDLEQGSGIDRLAADGIVVPGGFGYRGIEGKIIAARYARENHIPYLGLCLGMQVMCIELARHVLASRPAQQHRVRSPHALSGHRPDARSARHRRYRRHDAPGHLSLRARRAQTPRPPMARSRSASATAIASSSTTPIARTWRSRVGLSGLSPDGRLVEIAELRDHPWMVGSQFHPEFKSRPNRPHPLFKGFLQAVAARG